MLIEDTARIAAPPGALYHALLDAAVLRRCVPGARRVEGSATTGFAVDLLLTVGRARLPIRGEVQVREARPAKGLTFDVPGRASARIALAAEAHEAAPDGRGTALSYALEMSDRSTVVRFGGGLLRRAAAREGRRFFARLQDEMAGRGEGADA